MFDGKLFFPMHLNLLVVCYFLNIISNIAFYDRGDLKPFHKRFDKIEGI